MAGRLRSMYLSLVGTSYLIAFLSYYVQFPGLLSSSGVAPVDITMERELPQLYSTVVSDENGMMKWMDADSLCEVFCIVGVFLACLYTSGLFHNGSVLLLMTFLYYVLVVSARDFFNFQWDTLLLETGFMTALCAAPWLTIASKTDEKPTTNEIAQTSDAAIGVWPLRFLLFKLMFLSGIVKIQANCPTWKNLSALEYHFATQCLPTPLAWHAHQFPPALLRYSVAATFVIEIPAPFLLLAPTVTVRRLGAVLQLVLQVLIVLTGNYNFFNLLTMALCLPCMEEDWYREGNRTKKSYSEMLMHDLQRLLVCIFLAWSSTKLFIIRNHAPVTDHSAALPAWLSFLMPPYPSLAIRLTPRTCDDMVTKVLPPAVFTAVALLAWAILRGIWTSLYTSISQPQQQRRLPWLVMALGSISARMTRGVVCLVCLYLMTTPTWLITPMLQKRFYFGYPIIQRTWNVIQPYRIANSYGLFRRMTGVGQVPPTPDATEAGEESVWGWDGLPPSVVARPEVILEGVFRNTSLPNTEVEEQQDSAAETWRELRFRWKPGSLTERPKQVAPHQPRLDWLLWFAALGNYRHYPWFVHLLDKLLEGCSPVVNLLDEARFARGEEELVKVRARLWSYDFTRVNSPWNRRIPGGAVLVEEGQNKGSSGDSVYFVDESSSRNSGVESDAPFWHKLGQWPEQYWTRRDEREYFPEIKKGNEHVQAFVTTHGYMREDKRVCEIDRFDQCRKLFSQKKTKFSRGMFLCRAAVKTRDWNLVWIGVVFIFCMALKPGGRKRLEGNSAQENDVLEEQEKRWFKPKID